MRAPPSSVVLRRRRPSRRRAWRGLAHRAIAGELALVLMTGLGISTSGCNNGPNLSADYAQSARENYELAIGEFSDEDWDEAIQYADFVRIRFPFSRFSVEAELLIARAQFERGEFLIAQDAFHQFSKLHPTHKHVRNGWVSYMAAVSAYMNGPQQFFLLPPHYQRDQSRLREALLELAYFFDHYSNTSSNEYALELHDEINRRLLEHELYVARFYLEREKPEAAIGRLEAAHAKYPGIGLDAEVLFLLGVTYLRMDEIELSRSTFSELQSQHPAHYHGKQARVYLRYIYDNFGPADPARVRPDRSPPVPVRPPTPKFRERPERPDLARPSGTQSPPGEPPKATPAPPTEVKEPAVDATATKEPNEVDDNPATEAPSEVDDNPAAEPSNKADDDTEPDKNPSAPDDDPSVLDGPTTPQSPPS